MAKESKYYLSSNPIKPKSTSSSKSDFFLKHKKQSTLKYCYILIYSPTAYNCAENSLVYWSTLKTIKSLIFVIHFLSWSRKHQSVQIKKSKQYTLKIATNVQLNKWKISGSKQESMFVIELQEINRMK